MLLHKILLFFPLMKFKESCARRGRGREREREREGEGERGRERERGVIFVKGIITSPSAIVLDQFLKYR